MKKWRLVFLLIVLVLILAALFIDKSYKFSVLTLKDVDHYKDGDIVLIKKTEPKNGDLIIYDNYKNKNMCTAFGPSTAVGKVVGLPGEMFLIEGDKLKIHGEVINLKKDFSNENGYAGGKKYKNISGEKIILGKDEFLMDKWVGIECLDYNRFTVNRDAVTGVVVGKIWHSYKVEREYKGVVY